MAAPRTRKRAGQHQPVAFDPDRTPRQSGSYEIWSDACEVAIVRLMSWGEPRKTSPDRDVRVSAECAVALAQQITLLLHQVETWPKQEPTPETKTAIINEIMRAREVGQQLLQRNGATF